MAKISQIKYEFQHSLIAFLDILGFKEHIKTNENIQQELLNILYKIREKNSTYEQKTTGTPRLIKSSILPNITSFSDHIIMSIPLDFSQFPQETKNRLAFFTLFDHMAAHIKLFYMQMLPHGIVFRGAIAVGNVYFDQKNNIIVGEPLLEAIEDEAKLAIYPQIIASKSLLCFIDTLRRSSSDEFYSHTFSTNLRRDFDGMYYIDYLWQAFALSTAFGDISFLSEVREKIYSNIHKNKKEIKILTKWYWLANYFDAILIYWKNHNDKEEKLKDIKVFGLLKNNSY